MAELDFKLKSEFLLDFNVITQVDEMRNGKGFEFYIIIVQEIHMWQRWKLLSWNNNMVALNGSTVLRT